VLFNAYPGSVDWFNDPGWQNVIAHWDIAAWVARQAGFKGMLFDPEPYHPDFAQFGYLAQEERGQHTFQEYCNQARLRGGQVMRQISRTYPDMTLFCYFMNSVIARAAGYATPLPALFASGTSYDLLPPFIDGLLNELPPAMTLVDGCETAYRFNSVSEYVEASEKIRGICQELVSPENRAKYRSQVQVSFGTYLDAYLEDAVPPNRIEGLGGLQVDRLRENVATALRVADEYAWLWGERYRWWPTDESRVQPESWPAALPGCDQALGYARDPEGYARAQIAAQKSSDQFTNLMLNGDFGQQQVTLPGGTVSTYGQGDPYGNPPAGWLKFQTGRQEDWILDAFAWDQDTFPERGGCVRIRELGYGCVHQYYGTVQPGQRYAIRAVRRLQGNGSAFIRIRWQDPDHTWIHESLDPLIFCPGPPDEWSELFGVFQVPDGVGRLAVLLSVRDQVSVDDVAWFDDVELCAIA
jgi:hypothetical protein